MDEIESRLNQREEQIRAFKDIAVEIIQNKTHGGKRLKKKMNRASVSQDNLKLYKYIYKYVYMYMCVFYMYNVLYVYMFYIYICNWSL